MRLELRSVDKHLGPTQVLRGVSLHMQPDEVVVILGPNGSGKSTLLKLVAGIWEPDAGQIWIDGQPLQNGNPAARVRLGYVPDSADPMPDLLVSEFVSLVAKLKLAEFPSPSLMEQLGVTPYLSQRLATLSFGQRKRACLLAALIGDPALLLLDEPSNGIDPAGVQMIVDLIHQRRKSGLATLLATNDAPFAESLSARCLRVTSGSLLPVETPLV